MYIYLLCVQSLHMKLAFSFFASWYFRPEQEQCTHCLQLMHLIIPAALLLFLLHKLQIDLSASGFSLDRFNEGWTSSIKSYNNIILRYGVECQFVWFESLICGKFSIINKWYFNLGRTIHYVLSFNWLPTSFKNVHMQPSAFGYSYLCYSDCDLYE